MKNLVITIVLLLLVSLTNQSLAQKIHTETNLQYDKKTTGLQIQRLQFDSPDINVRYDYKLKGVIDAMELYVPIMNSDDLFLQIGLIKLGDWTQEDESFIDLVAEKKLGNLSYKLNIGYGLIADKGSRDYVLARITHDLLTVEACALSDYGYNDLASFTKDQYYWVAIHPENIFIAAGNEISRTWIIAGTKNLENFGNLSFLSSDRTNKNFWLKSQFGFGKINQNFYSLDSYRSIASYLIVPPFFYKHFSPISTKGEYALKIEGKRTGDVERWEITGAKKIGNLGRVAIGAQREGRNRSGLNLEYYKDFNILGFIVSSEIRYESICDKFTGFISIDYVF
ncbi:MAG: hypothetical protein WC456_04325 [Patescibacteria group bacterium]